MDSDRKSARSIKRLKDGMPLYESHVIDGAPLETALSQFSIEGDPIGDKSPEAASDLIRDLKDLLAPARNP